MATQTTPVKRIILASWWGRFLAWLIDAVVVGAVVSFVFGLIGLWVWGIWEWEMGQQMPWSQFMFPWRWFTFLGIRSMGSTLAFLLYWTICDSEWGQSLGKKALGIMITDLSGNKIDLGKALIESLGKALLLPLDILIGLVAFGDKRQRLFNRLSDTIVICVEPSPPAPPPGIEYLKK